MYGTHLEDKKICIEIGVDRKIEDFRQNIYSCSTPVLKNTMILLPTYATVLWIFCKGGHLKTLEMSSMAIGCAEN